MTEKKKFTPFQIFVTVMGVVCVVWLVVDLVRSQRRNARISETYNAEVRLKARCLDVADSINDFILRPDVSEFKASLQTIEITDSTLQGYVDEYIRLADEIIGNPLPKDAEPLSDEWNARSEKVDPLYAQIKEVHSQVVRHCPNVIEFDVDF